MALNIPSGGGDMSRAVLTQMVLANVVAQANAEEDNNNKVAKERQELKDRQVNEEQEALKAQNEYEDEGPLWHKSEQEDKEDGKEADEDKKNYLEGDGEGGLIDIQI